MTNLVKNMGHSGAHTPCCKESMIGQDKFNKSMTSIKVAGNSQIHLVDKIVHQSPCLFFDKI